MNVRLIAITSPVIEECPGTRAPATLMCAPRWPARRASAGRSPRSPTLPADPLPSTKSTGMRHKTPTAPELANEGQTIEATGSMK